MKNINRMTILAVAVCLIFAGFSGCGTTQDLPVLSSQEAQTSELEEQSAPEPEEEEPEEEQPLKEHAPAQIENMLNTVLELTRAPRPLGSVEGEEAADYLLLQLEEYGFQSSLMEFPYLISESTTAERYRRMAQLSGEAFIDDVVVEAGQEDGFGWNVIGRSSDYGEKEGILVLSAHYDTTPDSMGVLDNAAGVAVALEAARILLDEELPFALEVVFFGGEEEMLIGSRNYIRSLDAAVTERITGNINVDTLAFLLRQEFIAVTPYEFSQDRQAVVTAKSPVATALLQDERVALVFETALVSDHMAFHARGIDSVNFGQPVDDDILGRINSPQDTLQLLVPETLPVAADLLVDAVCRLGEAMGGNI